MKKLLSTSVYVRIFTAS